MPSNPTCEVNVPFAIFLVAILMGSVLLNFVQLRLGQLGAKREKRLQAMIAERGQSSTSPAEVDVYPPDWPVGINCSLCGHPLTEHNRYDERSCNHKGCQCVRRPMPLEIRQ